MSQQDINPEKLITKPVLKPVLFSILTLVSGIIIGSGVTLMFKKKPVPPYPENISVRMIEHLIRELQLSPEQQELLSPIVKQHMKAMDDIRQEARPKIAEEIKQMNGEIMAILDDGQKQVWNDKIKRMQDNFSRMRQRRRPERAPSDPNFRPDNGRFPRRYRNNRPPENRQRPDAFPPPEVGIPEESAPEKPAE